MDKLKKKLKKLEKEYDRAENKPIRRARILKQAKRIEKLIGST